MLKLVAVKAAAAHPIARSSHIGCRAAVLLQRLNEIAIMTLMTIAVVVDVDVEKHLRESPRRLRQR